MSQSRKPSDTVDQLVVVGASAGGIDALSILVKSLPVDLQAPIVIAQHLDPTRPSQLDAILSRLTVLPVKSVVDRESLIPGTIYVVPANRHVSITDHEVLVQADDDAAHRPIPSIDHLLTTASAVFGEQLIGVILTGSGSDGAAGAHAVKEAGGTIIIQDPATAAFPSMPRALAPPLVDAAVPIERIGPLLAELLTGRSPSGELGSEPDLSLLLERLRVRRGIDFSVYKSPTIERRLRRRMAAAGISTVAEYLDYLERDRNEEQRLVAHFLIKVTRFFRNPPLFSHLREHTLPELIYAAQLSGRELRLWSAGCATGEEAYSLALLVADHQTGKPNPVPVRIFATDLDETALAFARRGLYPASALADVPDDLVSRYFTEQDGSYEVGKEIRSLIVFGNHDLAQRPPFPHTDLVLCRNVLIYFTAELQKRALEIFAYSLRDGGYLVVGKSETPRAVDGVFATVDGRLRIYRREGPRVHLPPARIPGGDPIMQFAQEPSVPRPPGVLDPSSRETANNALVAHSADSRAEELMRLLPIGVAVINRDSDVEMINSVARELLGIHSLALGQDLIHLAHQSVASELRALIDGAIRENRPTSGEIVDRNESLSGQTRHVLLECRPDRLSDTAEVQSAVVLVQDVTSLVSARLAVENAVERVSKLAEANRNLLAANRELTNSLDTLRAQGDDLRLATAAAQVWAEEIETLNEELQSSNEELETLHEESQATVEELNVANEELEARAAELTALAQLHDARRSQLAAVLAAMDDAVIVVDHQSDVLLSNAAYDSLLHLMGGPLVPADDRGIPLKKDATPLSRTSRGEIFKIDFTARSADGNRRWFDAAGRPLEASEAGAGVVVIRDITDRSLRRMQEEFLQWAGHELRTPLAALQSYLQLALRQVGSGNSERLRTYLAAAVEQTRRQGALITELLDASRLKTGRLMLVSEPLDLVPLVEHVIDVAQVLANGQSIIGKISNTPIMVRGDSERIEQVILNLLLNAINYAPGTDRIEVELKSLDQEAEISIRDFGPGIKPQELELIFEQFSQGEPVVRPGTGGLGLGLFISREIVREHNGRISVDSTYGRGATFTVRLPLVDEPFSSPEASRATDELPGTA